MGNVRAAGEVFDFCHVKNYEEGVSACACVALMAVVVGFFLPPLNLNLRRYSNNEKRGYLHERSSESRMSHEHYLWFIGQCNFPPPLSPVCAQHEGVVIHQRHSVVPLQCVRVHRVPQLLQRRRAVHRAVRRALDSTSPAPPPHFLAPDERTRAPRTRTSSTRLIVV